MTPKELDAQSPVKINRWVDVHSTECKVIDGCKEMHDFTLLCIKYGFEDEYMMTDSLGRIWAKFHSNGPFYPFHTENGRELIGYRLPKKAAN